MKGRREEVLLRGEGLWVAATDWGNAVRYNGLGRYDDALESAERAAEDARGLGTPLWLLTDLIEAAVRSGKPERAVGPLERLTEVAEANGTDWALGVRARSRAMLSDGEAADALYGEAIERLARTRIRVSLARTHLVYSSTVLANRVLARHRQRACCRSSRSSCCPAAPAASRPRPGSLPAAVGCAPAPGRLRRRTTEPGW